MNLKSTGESYQEEDPTRPLQVLQKDAHMIMNGASEYILEAID